MTLEQECVAILAKQMGPAAKIFLERRCRQYLKKNSANLEKSDLGELAKCCFEGTHATLGVVAAESIRTSILKLQSMEEPLPEQ